VTPPIVTPPEVTPPEVTPPNRERDRLRIRMLPSETLETLSSRQMSSTTLLFFVLMLLLLFSVVFVVGLFFEQRLNLSFPSTFVDA